MATVYNGFKERIFGSMDLDTDVIRVALLADTQAYTPDIDNEVFVDDVIGVNATELSGTGYERKTATVTINLDLANDRAEADVTSITWDNISTTADIDGVLMYKQVGGNDTTPGDDPLIAHLDSADFPLATNGGDITLQFDSTGFVNIS